MLADIQPGQQINVTITSVPKAAAQRKTLIRLCEKDKQVRAERKRLKQARPVKFHRRGGRPWGARPYRVAVVKTTAGASYKIFASIDVLRDLKSIEKYVKVAPA